MRDNTARGLLTANLPIWLVFLMFGVAPAIRTWGIGAGAAQAVKTTSGDKFGANNPAEDVEIGNADFGDSGSLNSNESSNSGGQRTAVTAGQVTAAAASGDPPSHRNDALKEEPGAAIGANSEISESKREKPVRRTMSCLEPLATYFGRESGDFLQDKKSGGVSVKNNRDQGEQSLRDFVSQKNHAVRCLIAVVPSPVRSRQKYLFDVMVSAIQSAIELKTTGENSDPQYLFDGAWFPWTQPGSDVKRSPDELRQPGVIVYRVTENETTKNGGKGVDGKGRALVVLIVGHTAKTGVDKRAFATALDLAWQISGEVPNQESDFTAADSDLVKRVPDYQVSDHRVIRIVGPVFSGAQWSMENTAIPGLCEPSGKQVVSKIGFRNQTKRTSVPYAGAAW